MDMFGVFELFAFLECLFWGASFDGHVLELSTGGEEGVFRLAKLQIQQKKTSRGEKHPKKAKDRIV